MFYKFKNILTICLGVTVGIFLGFGLFLLTPYLPLSFNNSFFLDLGIDKPQIIGFLPYWLVSKTRNNYNAEITTLDYFSLTISSDGHIVKLTNPQQEDPGWYDLQTTQVEKKFQEAKDNHVILSLTVSQADEATITTLIKNPNKSALNLLSDVIPVMKKYNFSNLNVDIESFKDTDTKSRGQFLTFLKIIKNELKKYNYTLTVDIAPIAFIRYQLIDPVKTGEIADYMFIMGYDYHTVLSSNTGPIAPLSGINKETEFDVLTALYLAKSEIDPKKIIFGIPLYGYQWDSLSSNLGSATIPDTGETASNRRIESIFTSLCATCVIKQDFLADEPDFIYQDKKGDTYFHQAFLLDTNSFAKRILVAKENNFAGVGLWALGYEGDSLLKSLASYKSSFILK